MPLLLIVLSLLELARAATVVLITPSNDSLPFEARESAFTPSIRQSGLIGPLYASVPADACQPLKLRTLSSTSFLLVRRGECTFEVKVRHVQDAGFAAAIIYNNDDVRDLVIMTGDGTGITIPALFVSREAGFVLKRYAGDEEALCYLLPAMEYPAWSIMAVAFISLVAVTGVLATFFFVRRHRLRRLGSRLLLTRNVDTLSSKEVKALPTLIFRRLDEPTSPESCVICMEEYEEGQKLRILPCRHAFHAVCVDQWLTTRKRFCPVCKRDAQASIDTENTPLLLPQTTTEATQPPTQTTMQNGSPSSTSSGCLPIRVPSRGSPSSSSSSTFFQQHQLNSSHGSSCPSRLSRVRSSNSGGSSNSSWPQSACPLHG